MSTFVYLSDWPLQDEMTHGALPPMASLQVPTLAAIGSKDRAPALAVAHELLSVAPAATAGVVDGVGHQ